MTTFAVDVAVCDFFFAGITHADDLDLEIEALASERVVAIDDHVIAFHIADGHDLHAAVRAGCMELHADFQLIDTFEHGAVEGGNQLRTVFAVGILRLDGDLDLITTLLAFEGFFQTGNDVACTMQVDQRRAAGRAVDHLTGIIGEGVVD